MVAQRKTNGAKHEISTRRVILDLKREYAETFYDRWLIVSAEHGLLPPWREIDPYDTHIDDRDDDKFVSQLTGAPFCSVRAPMITLEHADEIDVLAGKKYCNAILEACRLNDKRWQELNHTFDEAHIARTLSFPFQEAGLGGIGEQMSWLKTALEEHLRRPGDDYKGQVGIDRYQDSAVKS